MTEKLTRELKDVKDRHYQFRKCCKNIFEDLTTLEEYEQQMKKDKIQKKKKEKVELNEEKIQEDIGKNELPAEDQNKEGVKSSAEVNIQNQNAQPKNEQTDEKVEQQEEKELEQIEKKDDEEEEALTVDCDLLFIMDCTGSMSSFINMCRTQLFLIVEQVKKQFEKSILNIGFVGFRDFGDSNQFDVYPFTTQYDLLKSFINGLAASGGNDTAEDVAGAFQKALEMDWKSEAKYAVLITDAYPHGNKYSGGVSGDRYPNGDPEGRVPEIQIIQMIKRGIAFYGLDVSNTSKTMYQIFNQVVLRQTGKNMDRISMQNAGNQNQAGAGIGELPAFAKAISTSVTNTITQTLTQKTLKSQKDVFNSKIMSIINNNRKFGSRFSKTNKSASSFKSDEDDELDKYNKFRGRYYDQESWSSDSYSSDSYFEDDMSDDDNYYYEKRANNAIQSKYNEKQPVKQNSKIVQKTGQRNYSEWQETEETFNLHQMKIIQQQKRECRIQLVEDAIPEEQDEENEEVDDQIYLQKRKHRHHHHSRFCGAATASSFSEQEAIQYLELIEGMKPSVRNDIIQEDFTLEIDEPLPPFSYKEDILDKNSMIIQHVNKEKKKIADEDIRERRIDPYIKYLRENDQIITFQSICYSFQIDDSQAINWEEPQLLQNSIKTVLTVHKEKFSEGAMREAFLATDSDYDVELVAKLHKEKDLNRKYNYLKNELTALILASFFLTEFNQRILFTMNAAELPPQILRFVDCYIYEVKDQNEQGTYFYSVENLMKGDFQKYNNNAGYVIDGDMRKESQMSQAFSHFTWQYSQGNCMVVDLQGTEDGQLTDPQIHTLKKTKKFGQGDLGYEGILRFFRTHTCTSFCKGLSLIHPKFNQHVDENYQFEDFRTLQLEQKKKLQTLKEQFNFEDEVKEKNILDEQEEESENKVEIMVKQAKVEIPVEEPKVQNTIEIVEKPEIVVEDVVSVADILIHPKISLGSKDPKIVGKEEIEEDLGIDSFFSLEIDEKIMPPDLSTVKFKPKVSYSSRPKIIKEIKQQQPHETEFKKDFTRIICSLCKKVEEYKTNDLLSSQKKLNQLICIKCTEMSNSAIKMTFDCIVCRLDFKISSYVLKMKRIDKAARCENCSLF